MPEPEPEPEFMPEPELVPEPPEFEPLLEDVPVSVVPLEFDEVPERLERFLEFFVVDPDAESEPDVVPAPG